MPKRAPLAAVVIASLWLSGCGTIANLLCKDRYEWGAFPFGGVSRDFMFGVAGAPLVVPALFALADLPLSFLGDLVTLPWVSAWFREMHPDADTTREMNHRAALARSEVAPVETSSAAGEGR